MFPLDYTGQMVAEGGLSGDVFKNISKEIKRSSKKFTKEFVRAKEKVAGQREEQYEWAETPTIPKWAWTAGAATIAFILIFSVFGKKKQRPQYPVYEDMPIESAEVE